MVSWLETNSFFFFCGCWTEYAWSEICFRIKYTEQQVHYLHRRKIREVKVLRAGGLERKARPNQWYSWSVKEYRDLMMNRRENASICRRIKTERLKLTISSFCILSPPHKYDWFHLDSEQSMVPLPWLTYYVTFQRIAHSIETIILLYR
jgi:hypothetical protein